jgi:hypothetical protein
MMAAINDDRNPQIADKITELHANFDDPWGL